MRVIISTFLFLILIACSHQEQLKDIDGKSYRSKTYQDNTWMIENLQVTKAQDGSAITFYYPNGDSTLVDRFGLLYDYETACKVCPRGWHLPTNEEWQTLIESWDSLSAITSKEPPFWQEAQNTNSSDFSIRPAGYGNNGTFDNFFRERAIFWSKTKANEHDVWTFIAQKELDTIRMAQQHPTYGFSIRCVKD